MREEKEDQNAKEETTGTQKGKKKSKQNQVRKAGWKKGFKVNSSIRVTVAINNAVIQKPFFKGALPL